MRNRWRRPPWIALASSSHDAALLERVLGDAEHFAADMDLASLYTLVHGDGLIDTLGEVIGRSKPGQPTLWNGSWFAGSVLVGPRVTIHPGSFVYGPAVLMDGSTVGPSALLKDGVILGPRSVAGFGCEVKGSILASDALSWHYGYIGNSVIGPRSRLGAGFVSAVVRNDGQSVRVGSSRLETTEKLGTIMGSDCKVGVHVAAMPGTVVAHRTEVLPKAQISGLVGSPLEGDR